MKHHLIRSIKAVMILLGIFLFLENTVYSEAEGIIDKPFVYDDHGRRDPLMPLVNAAGSVVTFDSDLLFTDLTLEGIMSGSNNESIAIINGRVLKKFGKIGDFVVTEIEDETVILIKGEKTFKMSLKKEE